MPTFNDITTFLGGQIFGQMSLPEVDLSGKTFAVTGANTGLGLECVKHLVRLKASKVILACRDITKGDVAVSSIRNSTPDINTELEVWYLDLACYESTQAFANKINSTDLSRLDGFVANAGVEVDNFQLSGDTELTIKVNVISTFMLALAMLPKLRATTEQFQDNTRLTIVGSLIHNFGPDSQLDVPEKPSKNIFDILSEANGADMAQRYPLSKLMGHLCSRELARHVTEQSVAASSQVIVNWVNPGWCQTSLSRSKTKSIPEIVLMPLIGWTAEKGSRSLIHGVTAGPESHGHYLSEGVVKHESWYVESEKGKLVGERVWRDLRSKIEDAGLQR